MKLQWVDMKKDNGQMMAGVGGRDAEVTMSSACNGLQQHVTS